MPDKSSHEELEKQVKALKKERDELASMLQAARAIPLSSTFRESARSIYDLCKSIVGATCGYVALLSEDGSENQVLFLDDGGLPCDVDPNLPMPVRGLRERAYRSGEPVFSNDFPGSPWTELMPPGHVELENVMFSPLHFGGKTVGVIGLANKPGGFTEHDREVAGSFGDVAALALKHARSYEALADSEEFSKSLLVRSPNPVLVIDPDTSVRCVNPAFERLTGFSSEEVVGARVPYPWWGDENAEKIRADWDRAMEAGADKIEEAFRKKSGEPFWVEITSVPIQQDGSFGYYLANWVDITERKRAESRLQESEQRYRTLFERNLNPIAVIDTEGRYVDANSQFLKFVEKSKERLLRMHVFDFAPPHKKAVQESDHKRVWKTGGTIETEYFVNGRTKILELTITPVLYRGIEAIVGIGRDITERKRIEETLRTEHAKFVSVMDSLDAGVCVIDGGNRELLFMNAWARRTFGGREGDKCWAVFRSGQSGPCPSCVHDRLSEREGGFDEPYGRELFHAGNGEWYACRGKAVPWSDGRLAHLKIFSNVTELKRAQEDIAAALREKEVLLREVHHRVKNNMQAIVSMLSLYTRRIDDARLKEVFDDCRDRIYAMSLVHESLYQSEKLDRIDFEAYLKKLCRSLGQAHGGEDKSIRLAVESRHVYLGMDQGIAVGLVVSELVSNAFKHAFPGRREGVVSVELSALSDKEVELIVGDDGVGLPADLDILESPSLGMRLAVATVTRQLGGTVRVEGEGGTRYVIRFKCKDL